MKNFLCLLIIISTFISCGEDISNDNTGAFRGIKDNGLWEGGNAKATVGVGSKLTIQAVTLTEIMSLKIQLPTTTIDPRNETTFVTHILGTNIINKASYILTTPTNQFTYETAIGVGDGEVKITQYDGSSISGTFRFNALNTDLNSEGQPLVNVREGIFYRVPVIFP